MSTTTTPAEHARQHRHSFRHHMETAGRFAKARRLTSSASSRRTYTERIDAARDLAKHHARWMQEWRGSVETGVERWRG